MSIKQLGWEDAWRFDTVWSNTPYRRRFSITRGYDAHGRTYTVCDHVEKDLVRVRTLAAARAWAGSRVGERSVRHGG